MKVSLNRTDFKILELLQNDGDMSNKVLAQKIGLAPSSCLQRVRRLKSLGVLVGSHAEVDLDLLGVGLQAMMFVRLAKQSRGAADLFPDYAGKHEEVLSVYYLSGTTDFLIHLAVRDAKHLRSLLLDDFLRREEIDHVETSIIFEHRRSHVSPNFLEKGDET